jgi:hypothetical protein
MIKWAVIFPFLFIFYLILNPLFNHLDPIDPAQAVRPLAALLWIAGGGMLLLYAFLKSWHYAGYRVFLLLMFLFVFGHLSRVLPSWLPMNEEPARLALLAAWGLFLAFVGRRTIWARFAGAGRVTPLLTLILTLALLSQILFAFPRPVQATSDLPNQAGEEILPQTGESLSLDCTDRPDIYYIILDGYGRADVLAQQYGVDTGSFLESLQRKGFTIASQSHSNYIQTVYSIASSLNFDFMRPEPEGVSGQAYFTQLIAENRIMQVLKQCGYQTVAFKSGFFFTNHPQVDLYLTSSDSGLAYYSYEAHRQRVRYTFNQLGGLARRPGPKFVFAHIISPHPPFLFDANGRPIEPDRKYSLGDGDDYPGSWEEYRAGYAGQVQFVNRMIEQTIDTILARSAKPPVIILQGDHGPGGSLDWDSPQETCLWERTSILNAYYLPDGGAQALTPDISPVNSFRVVLNATFDAGLELLPNRTFFTTHRLERDLIDITGERESTENCAQPYRKTTKHKPWYPYE